MSRSRRDSSARPDPLAGLAEALVQRADSTLELRLYAEAVARMATARGLPLPNIPGESRSHAGAAALLDATVPPDAWCRLHPRDLGAVHQTVLQGVVTGRAHASPASRRRAAGAWYTPPELVAIVLDRALAPLIAACNAAPDPALAFLGLRILDPACGAGDFLAAAFARLVKAAAGSLTPAALARSCLVGIDLDPVAVEIARAGLWFDTGGTLAADQLARVIQVADALLDPHAIPRAAFDGVVGNPPWIAHAGRAAQPLEPVIKARYRDAYPSFAAYPTTHGMFVTLAARALRPAGRLGLVLPASVSELDGYRPTRAAHDDLCHIPDPLPDFGEGRFAGVTQPCMALVSVRVDGGRQDSPPGSAWPVERPELDATDRAVMARLAALPTLPPELFGERGLQSDRAVLAHISPTRGGRFTVPLREGRDVTPFTLGRPRLHADPGPLGRRLRPARDFRAVAFLVRQTARFPIAALTDGLAFRNSILAGFDTPRWPAAALAALLNSALIRWHHYQRFRDARQPVLPQVKIGHLRAIPAPPDPARAVARLRPLGEALTARPGASPLHAELNHTVAELYGLSETEAARVDVWQGARLPPTPLGK